MKENIEDPRIATLVIDIGDRKPLVRLTEKEAINYILGCLHGGPDEELRRAFDAMRSAKSYRRLIKHASKAKTVPPAFRERFHTAWTVEGFRWREAVDDDALISRALRAILTPYEGTSLTLFRGERAAQHDTGKLGFNWTQKREVAEMFASGLCSLYEGGGILLTATAPTAAIISPPSAHSQYLGEDEFIVDPDLLTQVVQLVRYPQSNS